MVPMAKLAGRQGRKERIVFGVRRSDDDMPWLGEFKQHSFKRGKPRRIQVFDHLNDCSGVEATQPLIAIHERALDHFDACALFLRELLKLEPVSSDLDGTPGYVHAENL